MAKAKQKGRSNRPAKMEKVLELVQQCIEEGRWYDTRHATALDVNIWEIGTGRLKFRNEQMVKRKNVR